MLKGFSTPLTDQNGAPMQTVFSQQRIEAWRPLFTPVIVIIILLSSGVALSSLGIVFYFISNNVVEVDYRYDQYCSTHSSNQSICNFPIEVPKDMKSPIYLLYRLTNFYQNHIRYVNSRCDSQLRGEYADYDDMSYCGNFRSHDGSSDKENWILPCGAIATSLFNDTFEFKGSLENINSNNIDDKINENKNNNVVSFQPIGISWRSDREKLFKHLNTEYNGTGDHWLEKMNETFPRGQRNEHFIVWMRTAALPTFMKTYARCVGDNCKIPKGKYYIEIHNNYPTSLFNGEKHIVLSTVSALGGKNNALGLSYIIVGGILLFAGLIVLITHIFFPRKLGDPSYLNITPA